MKTAIAAGKTAKLKGRLSKRGLALLKQKGHVRVQVRVVLKAPGGTRASVTSNGTLRAPAASRAHAELPTSLPGDN